MKKLFTLILVMLAIVGLTCAQEVIYSVGCSTHSSGKQCAVLYRNNMKLYEIVPPLGDYDFESSSVVVGDGNVYWTMNSTYSATGYYNYGDVYKNGTVYLSNPGGQSIHLFDLAYGDGHVYAAGTALYNGNTRAVIFRDNNTTPYLALGSDGHLSRACCIVYADGDLYSAGYESTGSGGYDAVIWKNSEQLYNFGTHSDIKDIAYLDGNVYAVVNINYTTSFSTKVYRNNEELYTLSTGGNGGVEGMSICIDAGNIYVTGHVYGNVHAWKNNQQLYNITEYNESNSLASIANHKGLFHAGYADGMAYVWKNTVSIFPFVNCIRFNDLYVEVLCEDDGIRTLPFTDGFENNNTEWSCWTKIDVDHNGGSDASYWDRSTAANTSGGYHARHVDGVDQEDWLITPRLFLQPGRDNTTLTFNSREWLSYTSYAGVWVSTGSDVNNLNAYTEVWAQNHGSASWSTITIDLSAYQGQAIYIAFKCVGPGNSVLVWDIDDVSVTESWTPCGANATVPFSVAFENGLNSCWYVIDDDHSGDNKCWQYDSSSQCMVHPWGPSGVFQKGMLFTPKINLPSGNDYVLKFYAKSQSSGANMSNKVRIAVDESGSPDPSHYSTVLWTDQQFLGVWDEVEIPLSAYAGHVVTLCFDYEGTYAHKWYVDDVRIEEEIAQYTITANANNNAWGTVTGGGSYNNGVTCTLTATPASGYQFQSWKKNGTVVSTNASYTFTVTENATYTAYFGEIPINYYTITTGVNPAGAGSVTGGGTYQEGSSVTLTASANAGYSFSQWHDGNTENPRTIMVTGNATYTANFTQDNYTVSVYASPTNGGTVTGGGTFHYGETATLTATPANGYEFAGWSDANTDNPRIVTVTGDANYTAIFNEVGTTYFTVTTGVTPDGAGTVTGGGTYEEGSSIVLTAAANPGYLFSQWSDGVTTNSRTVTVNGNLTFIAEFDQITYTIQVVASPSTGGSVTGGGTYVYGDVATLYATPYSGYDFVGWSDGSNENPHQVTVTGNATYTATFSQAGATYYTVSAYVSPAVAGTVTGAGTYEEGSAVTLTATPNTGYVFREWNDGVTSNPRTVTVNNNMSFTAYFDTQTYTITANATPTSGGTVTGGGTYAYGATAVLTATPAANYSFMQWSDGNNQNPRVVTVTGNATYTALFLTSGGQTYTLTVTSDNLLLGSVYGSGTYPAGSVVEISAYPAPYATFVQWNDGNTENPRPIIIDGDKSFVAHFGAIQQYTIEVVSANEEMGSAYGGGTYNEGEEIGILAMANNGYHFTRWNDGVTQYHRMVTVTGNATYTAYFEADAVVTTYNLTLICNTDEGTVSGGGVYVEGATATIQAFPKEGFDFDRWNDGNGDNPRTLTMTSDLTMVAFFKSTGVDELDQTALSVYPNPANEIIRIEGLEGECEVRIYNALGDLVKVVTATADNEIGVKDLPVGLYLIRCGRQVLRFVKQ